MATARYRRVGRESFPSRPEVGQFVSGLRESYWGGTVAKRYTPKKLAAVLCEAEAGDISRQADLFDKMEEDPHLLATYGKRKRAVVTKTLQITAADESPASAAAAELCEEIIAGIADWREALFHLADAIGRGFSACQTVWDMDGRRFVIRKLQYWQQREFTLDDDDLDQIRVLTDADMVRGMPLEPYQWVVHRYKAKSGHPGEASLFRGLAWTWLFKHFSLRDWVIFCESCGMPRRVGTYPRGADDVEKQAVWAAARLLGRDGAAAIPEGARLEFVKAEMAKGELPFPQLVTLCDRYASKLMLGQTLTTEEGDRGARSLGDVHKDVQSDLTEADCQALAETIREQICAAIVLFNMGRGVPVPIVEFLISEDEDLLKRAERDKILAVDMGLPMSKAALYETYDAQPPADDEDRLKVPTKTTSSADAAAEADQGDEEEEEQ